MRWTLALILTSACWSSPSKPPPEEPKQPKDLVQPVKIEKQQPDEGGVEGGDEGGIVGGDPCGWGGAPPLPPPPGGVVGGPPPPPPPPPPPAPPQNVSPTLIEVNRIAGDKAITPDDVTKVAIMQSGKDRIIASFKLCVKDTGDINTVSMLKSSGFPAYDTKIMTEMRSNWRYRPYQVNGRAVPVCTAVTFIYSQTAPPPPRP